MRRVGRVATAAPLARRRACVHGSLPASGVRWPRMAAPNRLLSSAAADPYRALGVRPGASEEEVKEAYRKAVRVTLAFPCGSALAGPLVPHRLSACPDATPRP